MRPTERYIQVLKDLKAGDLGLLRNHAGQGLDESVEAFDLFAGLWWPLREQNQAAPRREVAWLVAKLYAAYPIDYAKGSFLACQLGNIQPKEERKRKRFQDEFDSMLSLSLNLMEPALQKALRSLAATVNKLDWVQLTDDLSQWERETTRLRWAEQFLQTN